MWKMTIQEEKAYLQNRLDHLYTRRLKTLCQIRSLADLKKLIPDSKTHHITSWETYLRKWQKQVFLDDIFGRKLERRTQSFSSNNVFTQRALNLHASCNGWEVNLQKLNYQKELTEQKEKMIDNA